MEVTRSIWVSASAAERSFLSVLRVIHASLRCTIPCFAFSNVSHVSSCPFFTTLVISTVALPKKSSFCTPGNPGS
uniref:Uncharacterized protein n=1 Tax=Lutzomyia longipalpis TaxID=7200 RepID=A0A7G3B7Z4_LUTLO